MGGQQRKCLGGQTVFLLPSLQVSCPTVTLCNRRLIHQILYLIHHKLSHHTQPSPLGLCCALQDDTKFLFSSPTLNPMVLSRASQKAQWPPSFYRNFPPRSPPAAQVVPVQGVRGHSAAQNAPLSTNPFNQNPVVSYPRLSSQESLGCHRGPCPHPTSASFP